MQIVRCFIISSKIIMWKHHSFKEKLRPFSDPFKDSIHEGDGTALLHSSISYWARLWGQRKDASCTSSLNNLLWAIQTEVTHTVLPTPPPVSVRIRTPDQWVWHFTQIRTRAGLRNGISLLSIGIQEPDKSYHQPRHEVDHRQKMVVEFPSWAYRRNR